MRWIALALVPALADLGCAGLVPRDVEPPDVHVVNLELLESTLFEQSMRVSGDVFLEGFGSRKVPFERKGTISGP